MANDVKYIAFDFIEENNNIISPENVEVEILALEEGTMTDVNVAWRPINATQDSGYNNTWTNISNAYDTDTSTSSTFIITGSSQSGFVKNTVSTIFNFDTTTIPANAIINSATLTIKAKSSATTNLYISVDVNGDSSKRIINETLMNSTSTKDYSGDITAYIKELNNIVLTHRTAGTSNRTFTCYDICIDVNYSLIDPGETPEVPEENTESKIKLGDNDITTLYLGDIEIISVYLGDLKLI